MLIAAAASLSRPPPYRPPRRLSMCSELFRIPIQWGGAPLLGFGLLLAVWLAGCAARAGWVLWFSPRRNSVKELAGLLPLFGVITAAILFVPRIAPEGLPIRGYGLMLVLASAAGLAMATYRAARRGVDADTVLAMVFWMFVLGIVGARVFFVIEYWETFFGAGAPWWDGLFRAALFTEGGLVVYGSLLGGAVAFVSFCRRKRIATLAMADLVAPSLVVGLAIGRVGCLLNGCCYGGVCDLPWAVSFPQQSAPGRTSPPYGDQLRSGDFHGFHWERHPSAARAIVTRVSPGAAAAGMSVGDEITHAGGRAISPERFPSGATPSAKGPPRPALGEVLRGLYLTGQPVPLRMASGVAVRLAPAAPRVRSLPVHPTQIYSAVHAALLGWLLWEWYPRRRRDGEVVGLLLTLYPIGRFLLEAIRTDESSFFGTGLSISQNVSLALLAAMVGYWWWLFRRPAAVARTLLPPSY